MADEPIKVIMVEKPATRIEKIMVIIGYGSLILYVLLGRRRG